MLPKLSQNFKIKSQDDSSKRINSYGQTRGGHARKRVARDQDMAAKTRPESRFRGSLDKFDVQFLWESCTETLRLPSPINTPAEQQRRASSTETNLGFFLG